MIKTGIWMLGDIKEVLKNGLKVFSCFHCGGGSTMGYKLAGYDVIGGIEIDPKMMKIYRANHNPLYSYLMGVEEFNKISNKELPKELFELDILDGSPPCSSFSMSGSREAGWGKEKKFREGQIKQVLDDLFFHFIETANKFKPKIVIAENVEGLIFGKAKGYVKQIFQKFEEIGYEVQLFLLNASFMGVPQTRKRVFFIARKKELKLSELSLKFNEKPVCLSDAFKHINYNDAKIIYLNKENIGFSWWQKTKPGFSFSSIHPKGSYFNYRKLSPLKPSPTLVGRWDCLYHWHKFRNLCKEEILAIQTFPQDYDFQDNQPGYVCGMSVPPFMMQRVALSIYEQFFKQLEKVRDTK